jgi:hypothetical protein
LIESNHDLRNVVEFIRIHNKKINIAGVMLSGKEDGYYVFVMPSFGISGYGNTEKEANESFEHNLNVFCQDLVSLSRHDMERELNKMGFKKEILKNKNFSKVYVDGNGILQNFEEGTAKTSVLETSACL